VTCEKAEFRGRILLISAKGVPFRPKNRSPENIEHLKEPKDLGKTKMIAFSKFQSLAFRNLWEIAWFMCTGGADANLTFELTKGESGYNCEAVL
jgi:hypothetical protein